MELKPPPPPLPPLNALRAFEAAARHGSFLKAAQELSVSPGAVAQQIRKLEDLTGVQLFVRHPQGVSATPLASHSLGGLTVGFEHLGAAARLLRQAANIVPIRIAALPAVAQLWIGPRLSALQINVPNIELSIHALDIRPELTHGAFDITIYPSAAPQADMILAENALTPIAAPGIAQKICHPNDLTDVALLHDTAWEMDWGHWLNAHNVKNIDPRRGPTFSLYSLAVERCVAGDGVLMGHTALVQHLINAGDLVPLFPDLAVPGHPICMDLPEGRLSDPMRGIANALRDFADRSGRG